MKDFNYDNLRCYTDEELQRDRGLWHESDLRQDLYEVTEKRVRDNAQTVAIVWEKEDLIYLGNGSVQLRVKPFSSVLELSESEPFRNQPVSTGFAASAVCVGKNTIVSGAHFIDRMNLKKFAFIFGYAMDNPLTAITIIPEENIYYGTEIIEGKNDIFKKQEGSDFSLIRLNREVDANRIARISKRPIYLEQGVYSIGYPMGLPVKYLPGGKIETMCRTNFTTKLDLFSGNSGSPIYCAERHELLGIVSAGDTVDFIWNGANYESVRYPNDQIKSNGTLCTKVSEFNRFLV